MTSVQLPDFILKDYKKEDGWVLIYNTITSSPIVETSKNYLMFYNKFTGILRVYYNHTNNVGTITTTFWRLALDRSLSVLNASGYFTHPMDSRPSAPEVYVSTINTTPAKAIYRGWNCFDIELCYDNQLAISPTKMAIAAYSKTNSEIDIAGGIKLSSEGSIITKGNSNPLIGPANKYLKQFSSRSRQSSKRLNKRVGCNKKNAPQNWLISSYCFCEWWYFGIIKTWNKFTCRLILRKIRKSYNYHPRLAY